MNEAFKKLSDTQLMALALYGEARGESTKGKIAVGSIILERVDHRDWNGKTIHGVCLKPKQFSCFNEKDPNRVRLEFIANNWDAAISTNIILNDCFCIALGLIQGTIPRTPEIAENHATQYLRVDCDAPWEKKMRKVATIGNHDFLTEA